MNLSAFYQKHLLNELLPFWTKAVDREYGGVFTCFDNRGKKLLSTDKYTWSQGRFVWLWSRLAQLCQQGLIAGDSGQYLAEAKQAACFLRNHAILDNGNCAYLLNREGQKKEPVPGQGYDTSFFVDCFVILGFSELARSSSDQDFLKVALVLYDQVTTRLRLGSVRSEPYPVPAGYRAHSTPMIMLNVSQELSVTLKKFSHNRAGEIEQAARHYLEQIMEDFYQDDMIAEILSVDDSDSSSVFVRHRNPGHAIESMWFVMTSAVQAGRNDYVNKAAAVVEKAFQLGWDKDYQGLLRFVDRDGGPPRGKRTGLSYEKLILDTWDAKLWWPHSEVLYTSLLAYELTGRVEFLNMYRQAHRYIFTTFPNPDQEIGEWIQIRDREGQPMQKVVALPVKDPYHIFRNVLLIIELLALTRKQELEDLAPGVAHGG